MENNMTAIQKIINRINIQFFNSTSGYIPKRTESKIQREIYKLKLAAALFTTAKT